MTAQPMFATSLTNKEFVFSHLYKPQPTPPKCKVSQSCHFFHVENHPLSAQGRKDVLPPRQTPEHRKHPASMVRSSHRILAAKNGQWAIFHVFTAWLQDMSSLIFCPSRTGTFLMSSWLECHPMRGNPPLLGSRCGAPMRLGAKPTSFAFVPFFSWNLFFKVQDKLQNKFVFFSSPNLSPSVTFCIDQNATLPSELG